MCSALHQGDITLMTSSVTGSEDPRWRSEKNQKVLSRTCLISTVTDQKNYAFNFFVCSRTECESRKWPQSGPASACGSDTEDEDEEEGLMPAGLRSVLRTLIILQG